MKRFLVAMLLLGTALLGVILYRTDLGEVWARLSQVGPGGAAALLLVYLASSVALAASWLFALPRPPSARWLYRAWKVSMAGAALDHTTPFAGLGGEPVRAIVLDRHYGVELRDGSASLVLTRTTDLIGEIAFVAIGVALLLGAEPLAAPHRIAAAAGLLAFAACIALFFWLQRGRGFTRLRRALERRGPRARRLLARAGSALDAVRDVEDRLARFYATERARFALSVGSAFASWMLDALATFLALRLLGHPATFADALAIEAFVALVRSTLFFVPGDVGTQEGAQVLICGALTGSPALGLALAALRRARDLLFILWGLAIGASYSRGRAGALGVRADP